ncbi:dolichyl-phosphate-mannose--protein mannosyltransferase [Nonomuraea cavernae]|uniref:Polyprenol-phosphate-mannose--protein mannosyltransferase n=1 Tax=Nonomuraea cavernae TaxID=2045107 RepID=A0A918DIQ7_9ACTN|nr:phospholipid carrier-dependent glycosyltransferase [Nonomuraea cavernae]MCA2186885.1 phospholipid carrier-dependent glycosyltransferase [Nonomuraea cavernae]GGO67297.1 phospholipid carrier-dependent glycosyltransferase [Nonomuraea cavernae]
MQGSALWGWIGPLLVTIFGGVLRFVRLDEPRAVVFDETFYIKDAYSLITYGVERVTLGDTKNPIADRRLLAGDTDIWKHCPEAADCASFVSHPPLGKWMIGAGEWLFGMTPFGWRFAAAVIGTLSILVLARVARRMTRSTLLGCLAGFLLALDGLHLVLSRTALLDIFLMFWVLAGFACLVVDRDRARERLVDWYETSPLSACGPRLGLRPWRIAAGVCLGAACAVKWSGVFFLIAFAVLSVVWDLGARRAVGLRRPYQGVFSLDVPGAAAALGLAPVVTFVATWTGWFVTADGYGRGWEQATSSGPVFFVLDSARSWLKYQTEVLGYHTGLDDYHPYMSDPWTWPLLFRPVSFHYPPALPSSVCGADKCSQAVLGVGTPALWYAAGLALLGLVAWYVATRDWRAGAVLLVAAAGWLPWFYYAVADHRTMYLFYMIPVVPFMVLALVLVAGLAIGRRDAPPGRRALGAATVGALALIVLINFGWLYPVLVAETLTQAEWWARMLMRSWVVPAPK